QSAPRTPCPRRWSMTTRRSTRTRGAAQARARPVGQSRRFVPSPFPDPALEPGQVAGREATMCREGAQALDEEPAAREGSAAVHASPGERLEVTESPRIAGHDAQVASRRTPRRMTGERRCEYR